MLYTYRCYDCQDTTTATRSVEDRHDCPECQFCGGETRKIITPVNFTPVMGGHDNPGYHCPVTDQWVDSKRKRRSIMDEHDLVELPKGSTDGLRKSRKNAQPQIVTS
jgi:putative FmdB family regulatory protein